MRAVFVSGVKFVGVSAKGLGALRRFSASMLMKRKAFRSEIPSSKVVSCCFEPFNFFAAKNVMGSVKYLLCGM